MLDKIWLVPWENGQRRNELVCALCERLSSISYASWNTKTFAPATQRGYNKGPKQSVRRCNILAWHCSNPSKPVERSTWKLSHYSSVEARPVSKKALAAWLKSIARQTKSREQPTDRWSNVVKGVSFILKRRMSRLNEQAVAVNICDGYLLSRDIDSQIVNHHLRLSDSRSYVFWCYLAVCVFKFRHIDPMVGVESAPSTMKKRDFVFQAGKTSLSAFYCTFIVDIGKSPRTVLASAFFESPPARITPSITPLHMAEHKNTLLSGYLFSYQQG